MSAELEQRIRGLVRSVEYDPASIGVLSTGERIAVALVLNRLDLLPPSYSHMLEAALRVQRNGWRGDPQKDPHVSGLP